MVFEYIALNKQGARETDLIDAQSEASAKQKLKSMGLYLVKITRHEIIVKEKIKGESGSIGRAYEKLSQYLSLRFSTKQIGIFSRQLATLLNAGMPLLVSITDIIETIDNVNFKRIVVDVKQKIEEGASLSNALSRHTVIFSEMYINMVRVGESLGSLDQVIERLADIEEKKTALKGKVTSALFYPAFLFLMIFAVMTFMMVKVVPSIAKIFEDMGKELPLPTRIVLGISGLITNPVFVVILFLVIILTFITINRYIKTPEGRKKLDELKLKMPLFSSLYKKNIVFNFTQNLGILLNNKVDILKSFEIVRKIVRNEIVEKQIEEVAKKVREGSKVTSALSKTDFLPKLVIGMINAGESSDKLDVMLMKIGNVYENELDTAMTGLASIIQPIVMVILGALMGFIIFSVMLPVFEMNLIV